MTKKMNPVVKAKWVAALRSGKYNRGPNVLRYPVKDGPDLYCCLGVLCEIAVEEGIIPPSILMDGFESPVYGKAGVEGVTNKVLPWSVMQWADATDNPSVLRPSATTGEPPTTSLAEVNDSGRYTFPQIADIIEEQL